MFFSVLEVLYTLLPERYVISLSGDSSLLECRTNTMPTVVVPYK